MAEEWKYRKRQDLCCQVLSFGQNVASVLRRSQWLLLPSEAQADQNPSLEGVDDGHGPPPTEMLLVINSC